LPDPVTLKRLATDFFVLRLAIGFGIRSGEFSRPAGVCKPQLQKCQAALLGLLVLRPMRKMGPIENRIYTLKINRQR
jgi:hypothetical protein